MIHTLQPPEQRLSHVNTTLAKHRLGIPAVVFFVMAAAAPLTVVAGGATAGFAITGNLGIPLSYLAVAVVLGIFSIGYVAMSRRIAHAGAFYTYLTHGLGRPAGVSGAFVAVLAYNLMQIGLYGGFGKVASDFLAAKGGWDLPWPVCALTAWAIVGVLGLLRIDLNGKVLAILLTAEVLIAVIYDAVMLSHPASGITSFATLDPVLLWGAGIGAALVTAITGFVGFEATTSFAEETRDPKRTVARATFIALGVTGVLYGLSAFAMSVAAGPGNIVAAATADGTELIFNLVSPHTSKLLVDIGHLLFITSLFAALLSFHHAVARYLYALGRERVLPAKLARTGVRSGAPINASLTQTFLALSVLILYAANGWDPIIHLFFWLTVLGGLGVLILMTGTSIAVIGYFWQRPGLESVWRRMIAPAIATFGLGSILWITLRQFDILLGVPNTSALAWLLPSGFAAASILGVLWAVILRATQPQIYTAIGLGPNSSLIAAPANTHIPQPTGIPS